MNVRLERVEPVLSAALAQRDTPTSDHCGRTGVLALALARELGIGGDNLLILGAAARLHDVGKIDIPDAILFKPGPLDAAEWTIMRTHSARGAQIVTANRALPFRAAIASVIYHHHEHYDGNGYPDGLRGENIPLLSRVISVADSYDAMTEPRLYHPKRSHHDTLAVLLHERGSKHDPQIVDLIASRDQTWFAQVGMSG